MKISMEVSERNFRRPYTILTISLLHSSKHHTNAMAAIVRETGQRGPEAVNAHIDMIGKQVARQQAATPESHGMNEHRHFGHFIAAQRI